jgi:crossover junction endodeoxyribonuclease RuvC
VFERAVLGVDPGIATAGLAVVAERDRKPVLVWSFTVRTAAGLDESVRLRVLYGAVRDAIAEHRPGGLAVERLMWGRNVGSAMSVARATGVVLLAAADAGIPVDEYPPLEVKMAVTGFGNAGKDQVHAALIRTHGLQEVPAQADAADAVAVALCHLTQSPLRRLHREAARSDVREALAKVTPLAAAGRRRSARWDAEP